MRRLALALIAASTLASCSSPTDLCIAEGPAPDPAITDELYERAYGAYLRSLKLLPDDPGIVNDTAVMLHYYLDRGWDQALVMYARSTELAEKMLADPELDMDERSRIETVLMDSVANYRLLLKRIARRDAAAGEAADAAPVKAAEKSATDVSESPR